MQFLLAAGRDPIEVAEYERRLHGNTRQRHLGRLVGARRAELARPRAPRRERSRDRRGRAELAADQARARLARSRRDRSGSGSARPRQRSAHEHAGPRGGQLGLPSGGGRSRRRARDAAAPGDAGRLSVTCAAASDVPAVSLPRGYPRFISGTLKTSSPSSATTTIRPLGVVIGLATLAAALSIPAAAGTSAQAADQPSGFGWADSPSEYRGKDGTRATVRLPRGWQAEHVWGTDTYTDDSSVCTAQPNMPGSSTQPSAARSRSRCDRGSRPTQAQPGTGSRPRITAPGAAASSSWPSSPGGGVSGVKMGGGGWTDDVKVHRGHNGSRYLYVCPAGGAADRRLGHERLHRRQLGLHRGSAGRTDHARKRRERHDRSSSGPEVLRQLHPQRDQFASVGLVARQLRASPARRRFPGSPGGGGGGGATTTTTPSGATGAPPTATTTGTVLVNGQPFTSGTIPYGATVDVTQGTVVLKADVGTLKVNGAGGISAVFVLLRAHGWQEAGRRATPHQGRLQRLPETQDERRRATDGDDCSPDLGRRQGKLQDEREVRLGHGAGDELADRRPLRRNDTSVKRGVIQVADVPRARQVTVRAGRSYLAKP